jgi:hypothetical protein
MGRSIGTVTKKETLKTHTTREDVVSFKDISSG